MQVKGSAFMPIKLYVVGKYGEDEWKKFMEEIAERRPYFQREVVVTSRIPVEDFLFFVDEYVRRFHRGKDDIFWHMGRDSARWALTSGPYQHYGQKKDLRYAVETGTKVLFSLYYDEGYGEGKLDGDRVIVRVGGLPVRHLYFEHTSMGYTEFIIEYINGKRPSHKAIKSLMKDGEAVYEFYL